MCFHLAGTDFFEPITDADFLATQPIWDQEIISENKEIYRAEYLAYKFLRSPSPSTIDLESITTFAASRYTEGYTKGVHDHDALKILEALFPIHQTIGLLKYSPATRAAAILFWNTWDSPEKDTLTQQLETHASIRKSGFTPGTDSRVYISRLQSAFEQCGGDLRSPSPLSLIHI